MAEQHETGDAQLTLNIDDHPLRYSPTRQKIEDILIRRCMGTGLSGYTLATSLEIAEFVCKEDSDV